MDICFERYFELSRDEYLKIKKFIVNNMDTVESILAPMHKFFDLSKKYYDSYSYCHSKKNNRKCMCLTDKYK